MRDWLRRRRWLGGLLIAVLLFGQTAAVVYACERDLLTMAGAPGDVMAAPHGDGCTDHARATDPATDPPVLCKAHCEADRQSVNSAGGAPTLPPADALGAMLWHLPDPADVQPRAVLVPGARASGPPCGFPPLYLSLLVLRN